MKCARGRGPRAAALIVLCLAFARPAASLEWFDGRLQVHGYWELQLRWLSDGYDANNWYHSQWANVLNVEIEADIAPDGFGPFDLVTGFARVEGRFECAFSGCIIGTDRHFGDAAYQAPARNWRDGVTSTYVGDVRGVNPREYIHKGSNDLLTLFSAPIVDALVEIGAANLDPTLAPVADDLFTYKLYDGTREPGSIQLGPWSTRSTIRPIGSLRDVPNITSPLPMRPLIRNKVENGRAAQGLYVPSQPLLDRLDEFGPFDQNFSQEELEWNFGASQQDTAVLKEAYLDLELFDSRLWLRVGLQNIVWGKTELFRTTDQFNPQDIGLSSLPSLEESRIALWAVRGVWSFYDVGPVQDVRLELAANFDNFEPIDLGRCGEPYTVWLVCGKSLGLWGHGVLGVGLAGELRPPDGYDDIRGIEVGGRLEWRWDRFSFALTDFWGYRDSPVLTAFHFYERNVDPVTGRPLDLRGEPLTPGNARTLHPGNRQLFDLACSATVGVAAALLPALGDNCLVDVLNSQTDLLPALGLPPSPIIPSISPAEVFSGSLAGGGGNVVAKALLEGSLAAPYPGRFVVLNPDVNDGMGNGAFFLLDAFSPTGGGFTLGGVLTDEQEALVGCGPFYGTDCDIDGVDLFNAEASVLIQSFPYLEDDPPVATRFVNDMLITLPGARGPGDPGYDPRIDGCPSPRAHRLCAGAATLRDPITGRTFRTEMEALSLNFARLLALLGIAGGNDPDCTFRDLANCGTLSALLAVTGVQRPEMEAGGNGRFGRRDFLWHGGGEALLFYPKENVLGFSMDFAEDATKSNWSFEFTWIADSHFSSLVNQSLYQQADVFNLTVSADRPTFINFLNANRTFFFNTQWFFQYVPEHDSTFTTNGPWNILFTMAVSTGYFQDRLIPSLVYVHDIQSSSGGILPQMTYRFSQDFAATVGLAIFYGNPGFVPLSRYQLAISNNGTDFRSRTSYQGLSPIAERDEIFLRIRYTF